MAKYRMTPKRRAALHKAQLASARKRRSRRNKGIAVGLGVASTVVAAGVLGYGAHSYVKHLRKPYRPSAFNPTHQLALTVGTSRKVIFKTPRQPPNRPGAFKVPTNGLPYYVRRPRGIYDANRRAGRVKGYYKVPRGKYATKTFDGVGMSDRTRRRRAKKRG